MMVEPTETENQNKLSTGLSARLNPLPQELRDSPEELHKAPQLTRLRRLNEAQAARKPVLRWNRAAV